MPGKDDALIPVIEGLTAEVRRIGDRLELRSVALPEPRASEMKLPRKMNWLTFARAVPAIFTEWDGFKTIVPEEFVNADADEDGTPLAVIACPCGETPAVAVAATKVCGCRRVFFFTGHVVRVYKPPPMTDEEFG